MAREKIWPDGTKALQDLRTKGKQRTAPPVNLSIQNMIRENTVHVFNVGPWGGRENMGSFGYRFIPPCEVGAPMEWSKLPLPSAAAGVYVEDIWEVSRTVKNPRTEYAACRPLPGLMLEQMPDDEFTNKWNMQDEGRYFALQMLHVGIGHDANTSWERKGCFVAAGKVPTEAELKTARAEVTKFMTLLILDADRAWAAGPIKSEQIIRPEIHHVAAEWLGLEDREWLRGTNPQGRIKCEMCGQMVDAGIATCQNGHIVDAEAYKRAYAQQEAIKKSLGA